MLNAETMSNKKHGHKKKFTATEIQCTGISLAETEMMKKIKTDM